jgi:hypothetical protein
MAGTRPGSLSGALCCLAGLHDRLQLSDGRSGPEFRRMLRAGVKGYSGAARAFDVPDCHSSRGPASTAAAVRPEAERGYVGGERFAGHAVTDPRTRASRSK